MTAGLNINYGDLLKGENGFIAMSAALEKGIDDALNGAALEIEVTAKRLAPKDRGTIAQMISANISGHLEKEVNVNAFYAAWIEFGTGKYAAAYVSTLPAEWKAYASQFRGKSGGTFDEMIERLSEWVRRKGIATAKDAKKVGYLIARSILRNGVRPHPFLYPAFEQQRPLIIQDIENVIKSLK